MSPSAEDMNANKDVHCGNAMAMHATATGKGKEIHEAVPALVGHNTNEVLYLIKSRRVRNKITQLRRDDGTVVDSPKDMGEVITDYFGNLFTASHCEMIEVLDCITSRIQPEDNSSLLRAISVEEVEDGCRSFLSSTPVASRQLWFCSELRDNVNSVAMVFGIINFLSSSPVALRQFGI
nr:Transposon TX1 uncharacterized [Ipomoea batatas]